MSDYLVDGPWLMERTSRVLSELKRLKKMLKDGKKRDGEGASIPSQIIELKTELNLLKEIFNHATDVETEREGKG